jgi:hypothetical protein
MEEVPVPEERPLDPTKLMRIASMVKELLAEARQGQPSPEAAEELAALYGRVKKQLDDALPEFLVEEIDSMELDLPFRDGATAEEVRVAYSALIGWMNGLFQGLQASFQAQAAVQLLDKGAGPTTGEIPGAAIPTKREGYL